MRTNPLVSGSQLNYLEKWGPLCCVCDENWMEWKFKIHGVIYVMLTFTCHDENTFNCNHFDCLFSSLHISYAFRWQYNKCALHQERNFLFVVAPDNIGLYILYFFLLNLKELDEKPINFYETMACRFGKLLIYAN